MSTYSRVESGYPFGNFKPFLVTKYHILPNDLALKIFIFKKHEQTSHRIQKQYKQTHKNSVEIHGG
jgi:hypothetical protein